MRILIVTEHYWPEQFSVTDLAEGLCRRGHSVQVVAPPPNYPEGRFYPGYGLRFPRREERRGVHVLRVPVIPRGRGSGWNLALNYISFAATASTSLALASSRWDAALVYQPSPVTTAIPALALRLLSGIPVAMWVLDLWPDSLVSTGMVRSPLLLAPLKAMSNYIYRRCDRVLGQSNAFVERFAALGIPRRRLAFLPSWAEDHYRPLARPAPREAWEDGFSVMFAGNLGRAQSLETVLDAAILIADRAPIHWVFVGDGSRRTWLQAEVSRRGLRRVHFLGRRGTEEMPDLFSRASVMVASLGRDESLGMTIPAKIQAYLACGRPVLASMDGEGARVVTESGAGLASRAGDAEGLATNVIELSTLPPEERDALGRNGRAYYLREFGKERCLDTLEHALVAMVTDRGRERPSGS